MATQDTRRDMPSHTAGTARGEERSGRGHRGRKATRGSRPASDATGINARERGPIDPRMPSMPPA
jgi:hypothetical protein